MEELICWNCGERTPAGKCINCGKDGISPIEVSNKIKEPEHTRVIEVRRRGKSSTYLDLNALTSIVNHNFKVKRSLLIDSPKYLVEAPSEELEIKFNTLLTQSQELLPGLTPKLQKINGERNNLLIQYAFIEPRSQINHRKSVLLIFFTYLSIFLAGIYNYSQRQDALGIDKIGFTFFNLELSLNSVISAFYFSSVLLSILLIKDVLQVYIGKKLFGIKTTTYFIPAPPVFEIGTLGSFIGHNSLHKTRKSMFYTALVGPVVAWLVSSLIILFTLSLAISNTSAVDDYSEHSIIQNGKFEPLILKFLAMLAIKFNLWNGNPDAIISQSYLLHPITIAAIAGIYLSGLNLLPASYLNGGHITRAKLGRIVHLFLTYFVITSLFFVNFFFSLLLLVIHQRLGIPEVLNEESKMDKKTTFWFVITIIIALLSFPFKISLIY